jgi:very-short-patch-repair endonuclease
MVDHTTRARRLPKVQTKAESCAWWLLRSRNPAGFKFRRQHPIGPFFADFCCPELKLVVELEGSVHSQPSVIRDDRGRDEFLKKVGYSVVHCSNGMILKRGLLLCSHEYDVRSRHLSLERGSNTADARVFTLEHPGSFLVESSILALAGLPG